MSKTVPATAPVHVRSATLGDLKAIVDFNICLAEDSGDQVPERAVLERGVQRALAQPGLCRYFLAERDGKPLGQAMVTFELTDWRDGMLWWLQSVYVVPNARRTGVFRALFEHIEVAAREDESGRGLRLYVLADNERAQDAYRGCGMRQTRYVVWERAWDSKTD